MPYLSSIEREALVKGHLEEIQRSISKGLQIKFGAPGKRLASKVRKIDDLEQVRALFEAVFKAENLAEIRALLPR